jgi:excisionase family DNA binding protein
MSSPKRQCDSGRSEAPNEFKFLRVPEVASILRVSKNNVLRLLRERKLPGKKLGNLWLIHAGSLERYLRGLIPADATRGKLDASGSDQTNCARSEQQ